MTDHVEVEQADYAIAKRANVLWGRAINGPHVAVLAAALGRLAGIEEGKHPAALTTKTNEPWSIDTLATDFKLTYPAKPTKTDEAAQIAWQPIETAPEHEFIDIWIAGTDKPGWRVTGQILSKQEPIWIKTELDDNYWPHENGGYATHWMPLPEAPSSGQQETE